MEKEMATHSSVLAWRIPGTAEPGWLPSIGSHRVGHDWSDLAAAAAGFPSVASGKESTCQCKRCGFDLWVGKITWSKKWYPNLQYSCLENSMGRGAWQATVHAWDCKESDTTEQLHIHSYVYQLKIFITYCFWRAGNWSKSLTATFFFFLFFFFCCLTCLFNL